MLLGKPEVRAQQCVPFCIFYLTNPESLHLNSRTWFHIEILASATTQVHLRCPAILWWPNGNHGGRILINHRHEGRVVAGSSHARIRSMADKGSILEKPIIYVSLIACSLRATNCFRPEVLEDGIIVSHNYLSMKQSVHLGLQIIHDVTCCRRQATNILDKLVVSRLLQNGLQCRCVHLTVWNLHASQLGLVKPNGCLVQTHWLKQLVLRCNKEVFPEQGTYSESVHNLVPRPDVTAVELQEPIDDK
mmetsp:Transcript_12166/g.27515  ORF Transcript_12166/g.27515 Transcript_12166/m.27515 type:complete len:247 (-) Transcript_12166:38-778(-)